MDEYGQFLSMYKDAVYSANVEVILNQNNIQMLRNICNSLLSMQKHGKPAQDNIRMCLEICNCLYENSDLDDSEQIIHSENLYDPLVVLAAKYDIHVVGAPRVEYPSFHEILSSNPNHQFEQEKLCYYIGNVQDELFPEVFNRRRDFALPDIQEPLCRIILESDDKRYRDTSHGSPELVGTLTKQKYALNYQAEERGLLDKPNITTLERDFFGVHIRDMIYDRNRILRLVLELKADGISIEGTVRNKKLIRAVSRGDTENDVATNLTNVFYGYRFPYLPDGIEFDCKFEAVMTYLDLQRFNATRKVPYKNCRSAIVGLLGSNDAYMYQEYITLIPLKIANSSMNPDAEPIPKMNRIEELEFLNTYMRSPEILPYAYVEGDINTVLFLIKKFVEEAEFNRPLMPYLYDGVVVSYLDDDIIEKLGRRNSINMYSTAVKFEPSKQFTKFLGYTFNVGKDGTITPMFHYEPVSFMGNIQTKSSGSSYQRFIDLALHVGDIVQLEYINDVIAYLSKPDSLSENVENAKVSPLCEFPKYCPCCGTELVVSKSGKSIKCPNLSCIERNVNRIADMFDKLGFKDIAEKTIEKIVVNTGAKSIPALSAISVESLLSIVDNNDISLGQVAIGKFIDQMQILNTCPIEDYKILGSIGYSSVGRTIWKLLCNNIDYRELIRMLFSLSFDEFKSKICHIKGIGEETANTIFTETDYYKDDLTWIYSNPNIISTFGTTSGVKIRFSGFRNQELSKELFDRGFDADPEKSVTKDTKLLIIPDESFTSGNVTKAMKYGVPIISITEFLRNKESVLQNIILQP